MGKIQALKSSWIRIGDRAINLNSFSSIQKGQFGHHESEDSYYIEVTDLNPNEDGTESKYMITTYRENEEDIWRDDFEIIIDALDYKDEQ